MRGVVCFRSCFRPTPLVSLSPTAELEVVKVCAVSIVPASLALMVQVPTATPVTLLPTTVQTVGVAEVKLTAMPELAVALKVALAP